MKKICADDDNACRGDLRATRARRPARPGLHGREGGPERGHQGNRRSRRSLRSQGNRGGHGEAHDRRRGQGAGREAPRRRQSGRGRGQGHGEQSDALTRMRVKLAVIAALCGLLPQPSRPPHRQPTARCCRSRRRRRRASPARRLQESKHQRRVEKSHLPKDAPNILIIMLDDVGFGLPDTFGGPIHTPTLSRLADAGHQLQRLPHHVDLLADPRGAADRAQPSARRLRHDRRARGRLGRLHRRHPAHLGDRRQGARRTTATRPRPSASGTTRPRPRPRRWGRSRSGRPAKASASTTSTASSPARPRSGSRGWSRISTRSSRRTTRSII